MAPHIFERVMLKEEVIFALVVNQPVGIVHPITLR
jgi:hypothetical protein